MIIGQLDLGARIARSLKAKNNGVFFKVAIVQALDELIKILYPQNITLCYMS